MVWDMKNNVHEGTTLRGAVVESQYKVFRRLFSLLICVRYFCIIDSAAKSSSISSAVSVLGDSSSFRLSGL